MKQFLTGLILLLFGASVACAAEAAKDEAPAVPAPAASAPAVPASAVSAPAASSPDMAPGTEYVVGVDDIMDISVLQPEKLLVTVSVAPDGSISFPYVGSVRVNGLTLTGIQKEIQDRLSDGYMKYPVVSVSLREARSHKFFVYGEVMRPGTFQLEGSTTVLRAISMAGGFTKFGSTHVKVLRPRSNKPGYETIKVNIKAVMDGNSDDDLVLQTGDIVVVSQGVF
ncbi:MAG TPA: polysaccharide biosynthesis/export family protein [Candidatus Omnitrophota bacterium]|nr:polysaccharide biosynthesis/export family protein [Candidatus Omnitrophota bacterium]HRZ14117.1 polysaccharide biosynthesis/export family protein [Candidatus Omnitrophota bacterium]